MANKPQQPLFPLGLATSEQSAMEGILNTGVIEHGPDAVMTLPEGNVVDGLPSSIRYNPNTDQFEGFYAQGGWSSLGGGGGIRWEALPHAATANLATGRGYLIDNTSGVSKVVFPTPTKVGDSVTICDAFGKFSVYPLTVNGNGKAIYGSTTEMTLSTDNVAATFTWTGDARGWVITAGVGLGQGRVYSRTVFTSVLSATTSKITLTKQPSIVDVYVDGKRLIDSKYTLSGYDVNFAPSLASGSEVQVIEYTPIQLSEGGGGGGSTTPMITWVYRNGSALGGETTIVLDVDAPDVPEIFICGVRNQKGLGYDYDASTNTITLAEELETGDDVVVKINAEPGLYNQIDRTPNEVARAANVPVSAVIMSSDVNSTLGGKTVIFDEIAQKIWALPSGIPSGSKIITVNGSKLTYTGNVIVDLVPLYGPADVLNTKLTSTAGAALVNTLSGKTVQQSLNEINSTLVTSIIPPSIPAITNGIKAVVKGTGNDFYVVTRKANGKFGYVSIKFTKDVATADAQNYGGASCVRPSSVDNLKTAIYAKLVPSNKPAGVTLSTFTAPQIETLFGYSQSGTTALHATLATGDYSLLSPQVYSIPNGNNLTYQLSSKKAKVRFAMSNGSSAAVTISISRDGTNFLAINTVNCQLPPSGQAPLPMDVDVNGLSGTWYLRISNTHANPAYVVGLNIMELKDDHVLDYDGFIGLIINDYGVDDGPSYYFGGTGATEFAAKEFSTGKFFGTFHGGHTNLLERLRTENASYKLDETIPPVLLLTRNVTVHTSSDLVVGSTTYKHVASTQVGDGTTVTTYMLKLFSGTPVKCERVFTHMATSARNFDWIHLPDLVNKTDDGDVSLGQTGFIQQFRAVDAQTINCYFSQVNVNNSSVGGAQVSFQPNYNKQYYGPILASSQGVELPTGVFTTAKEFF